MRNLTKKEIPKVLADNAANWTDAFKADPKNKTNRYRYRHSDIKKQLVEETSSKCVYCESKIGHNTPGDVEHKIPTDKNKDTHFDWKNLTIACTECNRRKLSYYSTVKPFLDPYNDDVENRIKHLGPIVSWLPGDDEAEITVRTLEMHNQTRKELIARKVELIEKLNNTVARMKNETGVLQEMMLLAIEKMKEPDAEYSGMVRSVCSTYGI